MTEEHQRTSRGICPRCGEPILMVRVDFERATMSPCQHTTAPDRLPSIDSSLR